MSIIERIMTSLYYIRFKDVNFAAGVTVVSVGSPFPTAIDTKFTGTMPFELSLRPRARVAESSSKLLTRSFAARDRSARNSAGTEACDSKGCPLRTTSLAWLSGPCKFKVVVSRDLGLLEVRIPLSEILTCCD